jgi:hypothetical protein
MADAYRKRSAASFNTEGRPQNDPMNIITKVRVYCNTSKLHPVCVYQYSPWKVMIIPGVIGSGSGRHPALTYQYVLHYT